MLPITNFGVPSPRHVARSDWALSAFLRTMPAVKAAPDLTARFAPEHYLAVAMAIAHWLANRESDDDKERDGQHDKAETHLGCRAETIALIRRLHFLLEESPLIDIVVNAGRIVRDFFKLVLSHDFFLHVRSAL